MPQHGGSVWSLHPHVRTGSDLSLGERASDVLKHWFGTWTLLGIVLAGIAAWITLAHDPEELHLNLILSCIAAVQGIVLQIASNRIDRVNAEAQLHHMEQTEKMDQLLAAIHSRIPEPGARP